MVRGAFAHGILLIFLFTLEHEAIHGTAFRTEALNRTVAAIAGFVVVVPALWFRYFHFAHHRHTQDLDRDPELASPKPGDWRSYCLYLTGLPYWKAEMKGILDTARGKVGDYVPATAAAKVVREARIHLALYSIVAVVSIGFGWTWPLELWVVPALLGQPFLRAYLLAEHGACPLVADMLANTRTTFTNGIVRFIAWNMPYHTAHHVLPVVPFHRLPRLTETLNARLASTAAGYVEAHRQIRKAWPS
ncbi:MAG: fatty acid desaturase [Parvibaculaceae bacterium]